MMFIFTDSKKIENKVGKNCEFEDLQQKKNVAIDVLPPSILD